MLADDALPECLRSQLVHQEIDVAVMGVQRSLSKGPLELALLQLHGLADAEDLIVLLPGAIGRERGAETGFAELWRNLGLQAGRGSCHTPDLLRR